jgi:AcrR family transcriptional regulator
VPSPNPPATATGTTLSDRRRDEIIDAAAHVFGEKGYHAAGIADIAAHLGVGHGTFYRYFKSKLDIANSAFDRAVGLVAATMMDEDPNASTTLGEYRAQVERILRRLLDLFDEQPAMMRFFHRQLLDIERLGVALDSFAAYTQMFVQNGVDRGYLRARIDAQLAAQALVAVLFDITRRAASQPLDDDAKYALLANAVDLMFLGLAG